MQFNKSALPNQMYTNVCMECTGDLCNLVRLPQRNRLRMLEVGEHHGAMGERAFSVGGPRLCNCLPTKLRMAEEIDDFKSNLKTYLFKNSERFYELVHMQ